MINCEELALYAIKDVLAYVEDTRLSFSLMCLFKVSHGVEVWKHFKPGFSLHLYTFKGISKEFLDTYFF